MTAYITYFSNNYLTKLTFQRSFWGTDQVWIMISTTVMTQNTQKNQKHKEHKCIFFYNIAKNGNGNICILSHNFWMNQGSDLFSTSKWPSQPQFCEIWSHSYQKIAWNGRKMTIYHSLSFPNSLYLIIEVYSIAAND